jgi:hypothetical protein
LLPVATGSNQLAGTVAGASWSLNVFEAPTATELADSAVWKDDGGSDDKDEWATAAVTEGIGN